MSGLEQSLVYALVNGMVWGLIIALFSMGLTLIFGLMRIMNIAHGEFYMLGAVAGEFFLSLYGNFWLALILASIIVGAVGCTIERFVLRRFEGQLINPLIITIGLMLIFRQVGLEALGGGVRSIVPPIQAPFAFYGAQYSGYNLFVAAFSTLLLLGLWLFLTRTRYGLWIRASVDDREMANAMGIPIDSVYMMIFTLGTALAACAGMLAAPIVGISHLMGASILIYAFMVIIIGGVNSLKGTLVGALLLSTVERIAVVFVSPLEARIVMLFFVVVVILARPTGIFGPRGRT